MTFQKAGVRAGSPKRQAEFAKAGYLPAAPASVSLALHNNTRNRAAILIAIGKLLHHANFYLRMVAVRHHWAIRYLRERDTTNAAVQFRAARQRLEEARNEL